MSLPTTSSIIRLVYSEEYTGHEATGTKEDITVRRPVNKTRSIEAYADVVKFETGIDPVLIRIEDFDRKLRFESGLNILIMDHIRNIAPLVYNTMTKFVDYGCFSVIITDDPAYFEYSYKCRSFRVLHLDNIDIIKPEEFGAFLRKTYAIKNLNIAMVTCNTDAFYKLIKYSFGTEANKDMDPKKDIEDFCDMTDDTKGHRFNIPICKPFVPKLFKGWIYRVWYMDNEKSDIKDEDLDDTSDTDTSEELSSYIVDAVSYKINESLYITYWLIVPNTELLLKDLTMCMDAVYLDLFTPFPLNTVVPEKDEGRDKLIPFVFDDNLVDISYYKDLSIGDVTRYFRNLFAFFGYGDDIMMSNLDNLHKSLFEYSGLDASEEDTDGEDITGISKALYGRTGFMINSFFNLSSVGVACIDRIRAIDLPITLEV